MLCDCQGHHREDAACTWLAVSWNRHLGSPKLSCKMSSYFEAIMLETPCGYTNGQKKYQKIPRCSGLPRLSTRHKSEWATLYQQPCEQAWRGTASWVQSNPRTMWENVKLDCLCKMLILGGNLLCSHSKWNTDPFLWLREQHYHSYDNPYISTSHHFQLAWDPDREFQLHMWISTRLKWAYREKPQITEQ